MKKPIPIGIEGRRVSEAPRVRVLSEYQDDEVSRIPERDSTDTNAESNAYISHIMFPYGET